MENSFFLQSYKMSKREEANLEQFSLTLGYTIGKVEINYIEGHTKKEIYTIGFLINSTTILCASKPIKNIKNNFKKDLYIIFYPTDTKLISKYDVNNTFDFVIVDNIHFLPEAKDESNKDPLDPVYYDKEWCILSLKNCLGDLVYSLTNKNPIYFNAAVPSSDLNKAIFVYLNKGHTYSKQNKKTPNDLDKDMIYDNYSNIKLNHYTFSSISLDQNKIIYGCNTNANTSYSTNNDKDLNKMNRFDSPNNKDKKNFNNVVFNNNLAENKLLILIPQNIEMPNGEGILFSNVDNKFSAIGIYNTSINSKKNIQYLERYFKDQLDEIQTTIGRISDNDYAVLDITYFSKERDIDVIERIIKEINQNNFKNHGLKMFSNSVYSEYCNYFNCYSKINLLLNYGEVFLNKIAKQLKLSLRNIDTYLLTKRIINNSLYSTNELLFKTEKLEFKNEDISPLNLKISLECFYMHRSITSISFKNIYIDSQIGVYIRDLFFHNREFNEVEFHNNKMKLSTFEVIFKSLINLKLKTLKIFKNSFFLDVNNNDLNKNNKHSNKILLDFFDLSLIPSIQRLYIKELNMCENSLISIFKTMEIKSKSYNDLSVKTIKENFKRIYIYKNSENYNLSNKCFINYSILKSERENLRIFNFSFNTITTSLMKILVSYLKNYVCLQEITLRNCSIQDKSLILLCECLKELYLLTELDLSNNYITSDSMSTIADVINNKNYLINEKYNNSFIDKSNLMIDKDITLIEDSKEFNIMCLVFNLKLNGNALMDDGLYAFLSKYSVNSIAINLEIEDIQITRKGIMYIIEALNDNKSIILLNIAKNMITDNTIIHICDDFGRSIKANQFLRKIIINNNFISKAVLYLLFRHITETHNKNKNSYKFQNIINLADNKTDNLSNTNNTFKSYRPNFSIICDPLLSVSENHIEYTEYISQFSDGNFEWYTESSIEEAIGKFENISIQKFESNDMSDDDSSEKKENILQTKVLANCKDKYKTLFDYNDLVYYIEYCR